MKKSPNFFALLLFLAFAAISSGNLINAQTGKKLSTEKGDVEFTAQAVSGDVDSSFVANLFTTLNQGSRASVSAIARQNNGKILVTGNFYYVNGIAESLFFRLNPDGSVDTAFNPPGIFSIQKILPLADGKILIGGSFSNFINGTNYRGLARLNEDGTLDDGFAVDTSSVSGIAVQPDGKIIIVGGFSQVNGYTINNVARLNTDGSLDTSFQTGTGTTNGVNAVAIQADGKILIGGYFTTFNNIAKPRLTRLNSDGSIDASFDVGTGPNGSVTDVILQPDNKILVGGSFSAFNGVNRSAGIIRLETNGTLDNSFAPTNPLSNASGVRIALQPGGKILAGFIANFQPTSSSSTLHLYNSDGTLDGSFNSTVNAPITGFVVDSDGKIIIGGFFSHVNGVFKNAFARLNPVGTTDNNFNYTLGFSASANVMAVQADGKILVGGNFEYVNETAKSGFFRLNPNGRIDESFNATGNFTVNGFAYLLAIVPMPDGKILIGGNFTNVNGQTANRIARLNSNGSLDPDFNIGGTGPNGTVLNIAVQANGKILLAGNFNTFNGAARQGIVRLNQNGSVDTSFEPPFASFGASITAMTLQPNDKILLGGNFTLAGGVQRRGIIRLNGDNGSLDESFSSLADNAGVRSIVPQPDGKILIGGSFYTVNGVNRRNIARLNNDGSVDLTFNPQIGTNNLVNSVILQQDGKIWLGGDFTTFNGVRRTRLARLNADGSLDEFNINPGANLNVTSLARQPDGRLLVGGTFTQIGAYQRVGLARVRMPRNAFIPLFDFDGDGKTDIAVFRVSSGAWYQTNSSNGSFDGRLFGVATDRIVPGDFDGDRKTDIAVWRPSTGQWFIVKSSTSEVVYQQFGANGDIPLPADFDGDGKDDLVVFRPSSGAWYILRSRDGFQAIQFGVSTDIPLVGDFDGDSKADIAVFRPSNGTWYVLPSAGGFSAVTFGSSEDIPVTGDYDGDGKTDFTVFRPSNGTWYLLGTTNGFSAIQFGLGTDRPLPGDFDGDGKTDIAVWRPSSATWYMILSSDNTFKLQVFGLNGDVPVPAAFLK